MYGYLQMLVGKIMNYRIHALRFVGIPIDDITSPSGESEHQFWGNFRSIEVIEVCQVFLLNLVFCGVFLGLGGYR